MAKLLTVVEKLKVNHTAKYLSSYENMCIK